MAYVYANHYPLTLIAEMTYLQYRKKNALYRDYVDGGHYTYASLVDNKFFKSVKSEPVRNKDGEY